MKICIHCNHRQEDSRTLHCSSCGKELGSELSELNRGARTVDSTDSSKEILGATLDASDLCKTTPENSGDPNSTSNGSEHLTIQLDHSSAGELTIDTLPMSAAGDPNSTIQLDYSVDDAKPSVGTENQLDVIAGRQTMPASIPSEGSDCADGTIDVPSEDSSGTADFSVDAIGVPPTATIHIHQGQITQNSGPMGSPRTMKGGSTFRSDSGSEHSASIWSTISRRKLGSDKETADVSADYTIVRKLGEGGMGVVYVALQKSLAREVAVKAIKAGQANTEESRKKFFYEAKITGELDHPNIVPIHELGANDDGTLFYSMKMVDGSPWEDAIKVKSREENLEIFMKVCDAIAFAHSHEVIHRDLKPENVMLGTFGEVLVMDWGLAVDLKTKPSFGMSGTPAYMSPEMASHQVSKIGKTSDIYLLGGILYQILTGCAPHTGKSVRDCLANAQHNRIVPTELDDPLLDIARVALATDPVDRFDSVVLLQAAIREHLQHAESIALSKRADETLERAIVNRDYGDFSRAIFSMQEAIDMWPANELAQSRLSSAQLAYGQCAFEQGDYDLCMQCLDSTNPTHADLLRNAKEKKLVSLQRESRLRWMRRTLASVITVATVLLSGATYYANYQANVARSQEKIAKAAAQAEKEAKDNESLAKIAAIEDRNKAIEAAEQERVAKQNEAKAREQAQLDRDAAIVAKQTAEVAKEQEAAARQVAVAAEKQATDARNVAIENARYTLLGSYQSLIGLSMSQNAQFNVQRSNQLLRDIDRVEGELANSFVQQPNSEPPIPFLKNWAYRRIELLNNADIEKVSLSSKKSIMDVARNAPYAVLSAGANNVEILRWDGSQWIPARKISTPGPVVALAIANDGQKVAIVIQSKVEHPCLLLWNTSDNLLTPFRNAPHVGFESVRFVDEGRSVVAGINGGMWKWSSPSAVPTRIDVRGRLLSLECFERDQSRGIGVLSIPNADVACVLFDWLKGTAVVIPSPIEVSSQLSAASISQDGQSIYLGGRDGRLWFGNFSSEDRSKALQRDGKSERPVSKVSTIQIDNWTEVTPRKHTAAIHGIRTTSEDRLLTYGDEPVVHIWQHENRNAVPIHECYLAGLSENVAYSQFIESRNSVVGVDNSGLLMSWSIADQIGRQSNTGLNSVAPALLVSERDGEQLWIDEASTVLCKPKYDESHRSDTVRHYFGHSPGVEITDSCVAASKPWLATIARIRGSALNYIEKNRDQIEVCIWNVEDGRLVQRHHVESDRIGRATFVDDDNSLLVTDGTKIYFVDIGSPAQQKVREATDLEYAASFSVRNPVRPNQIAILAKSGAIRILDVKDPASWRNEAYRYFDLAINNRNEPIRAVWSSKGDRLYVLFDHGGLTRLDWTGDKFVGVQSTESLDLKGESLVLPWMYVDLAILPSTDSEDTLQFLFRSDAKGYGTKEVRLHWPFRESNPTSTEVTKLSEENFLQLNGQQVPWASTEAVPYSEIANLKQWRDRTVAVLKNGNLAIRSDQNDSPQFLGRQNCTRASISQDHGRVVLCQSNQSILIWQRFDSTSYDWSVLRHNLERVQDCELSPDGTRLVILGSRQNKKFMLEHQFDVDSNAMKLLRTIESVERVVWHPEGKQFLFLMERQSIETVDPENQIKLDVSRFWDPRNETVSAIRLLNEPWKSGRPAGCNVVLVIQNESGTRLSFVPLNQQNNTTAFEDLRFTKKITSIATHGKESLLFLGDEAGGVSVWFASPTLDRACRELFTMPGHRGARVLDVRLSSDGNSLLTSDSQKRSLIWPSVPPSKTPSAKLE